MEQRSAGAVRGMAMGPPLAISVAPMGSFLGNPAPVSASSLSTSALASPAAAGAGARRPSQVRERRPPIPPVGRGQDTLSVLALPDAEPLGRTHDISIRRSTRRRISFDLQEERPLAAAVIQVESLGPARLSQPEFPEFQVLRHHLPSQEDSGFPLPLWSGEFLRAAASGFRPVGTETRILEQSRVGRIGCCWRLPPLQR